jgi:nucleoside phosphorylase
LRSHERTHRNIALVSVIRPELKAVLFTLGRDPNDENHVSYGPFRYWTGNIQGTGGSMLSYVLTMVGEPRNVPCAIAVQNLLANYSVDLLVLIGVAAGPHYKVNLGDPVAINSVYDYEHVRAELVEGQSIEKPRPEWFRLETSIRNDVAYFDGEGSSEKFTKLLLSVPPDWIPEGITVQSISPTYRKGTCAAGERLFADGALDQMWKYDERIIAGDMEDSGFAQVCEFYKLPWVIFRGIADFGDPHKNSKWHLLSSLSAASAAMTFLSRAYRLAEARF